MDKYREGSLLIPIVTPQSSPTITLPKRFCIFSLSSKYLRPLQLESWRQMPWTCSIAQWKCPWRKLGKWDLMVWNYMSGPRQESCIKFNHLETLRIMLSAVPCELAALFESSAAIFLCSDCFSSTTAAISTLCRLVKRWSRKGGWTKRPFWCLQILKIHGPFLRTKTPWKCGPLQHRQEK